MCETGWLLNEMWYHKMVMDKQDAIQRASSPQSVSNDRPIDPLADRRVVQALAARQRLHKQESDKPSRPRRRNRKRTAKRR
jgi:hypothetical protein